MKPKNKFWLLVSLLMVAVAIILPMLLHYYNHQRDKEQIGDTSIPFSEQEQEIEDVSSAAIVETQTTTTTYKPIEVFHRTDISDTTTSVTTTVGATTTTTDTTTTNTSKTTTKATTTKKVITTSKKITQETTTTGGTTGVVTTSVKKQGYYPSPEEWKMFCVVVCSETGYCEDKAQLAVAHTVINRLSNPIYPDTIKEILTQRAQYTCVQNYYTGNMRPGLEIGGEAYNHTMQLVHQAWEEWDFTNGAVAYYNPHMIGWNAWFEQYECVYEDEYGRFFKV